MIKRSGINITIDIPLNFNPPNKRKIIAEYPI